MPTELSPTDIYRPRSIWRRLLGGFAPFHAARKNPLESPVNRQILLVNVAGFWYIAWSAWVVALTVVNRLITPVNFQFWLPMFGVLAGFVGAVILWLTAGGGSLSNRRGVAFALGAVFWTIVVGMLASVPTRHPVFVWIVGSVITVIPLGISLRIKLWMVEIKPNQVYIIRDERAGGGFQLYSRPRPEIDPALAEQLKAAGLPDDLLTRFLVFGGPVIMRRDLEEKLPPGSDALIDELVQQVTDPARRQPPTIWLNTFDDAWLLWDKSKPVVVNREMREVITKDGNPVDVRVEFRAVFDPEAIRKPEFYINLPNQRPMDKLMEFLRVILEVSAEQVARLYFVNVPLQSALTSGSIEKFRAALPGHFNWAKTDMGLTVQPVSVQCNPILPDLVTEAEREMLASRARAQTDTAKLRVLLEQVIRYGVPPRLLAGLMFLDQGTDSLRHAPDPNVLDLPEPDNTHKLLYLLQKYDEQQETPAGLPASGSGGDAGSTPEDTSAAQASSAPEQNREAAAPVEETPPDATPRSRPGSRRPININRKKQEQSLTARRDKRGVFRVGDDDADGTGS